MDQLSDMRVECFFKSGNDYLTKRWDGMDGSYFTLYLVVLLLMALWLNVVAMVKFYLDAFMYEGDDPAGQYSKVQNKRYGPKFEYDLVPLT